MFDYIPEEKARDLIETNINYLSVIEALRLLQNRQTEETLDTETEEPNISEIEGNLNKIRNEILEHKTQIEREASSNLITTSMVPLVDGWYCIAFYSDKKHSLRKLYFALLAPNADFEAIEKHVNKYDNEHPKQFVEQYLDREKFLPVYKKIHAAARNLAAGGSLDDIAYMSDHAFQRYEERAGNPDEIPDATDDLRAAELVYEQETSGTKYYLNKESMLFYCVKNGVVATCWKHDFGFRDPKIHAQLVFMLLDKIKRTKEEMKPKIEEINLKMEELKAKERKADESLANINRQRKDLLNAAKNKKAEIKSIKRAEDNCVAAIANIEDEIRQEEALLLTNQKLRQIES